MASENAHDPRARLVREKYFSLRPQPLEQWIYKQGIAASAERVFWLHWQEGMRRGDWCSSISLKHVAKRCVLDVSSVTRAYQQLAKLGLIRRQDPGRDPSQPFQRAVCLTEVRLPRELLAELGHYPNRPLPRDTQPAESRLAPGPAPAAPGAVGTEVASAPPAPITDPFEGLKGAQYRQAFNALLSRLSDRERDRYNEAFRKQHLQMDFDENSQLDEESRAAVLQLLRRCASKVHAPAPSAEPTPPAAGKPHPRKLTLFELARLRRELEATAGSARSGELMREVVWAVEQGALKRFTSLHAVRIALKKIREGAWTRPNRMPPNWARALAQSDVCSAA